MKKKIKQTFPLGEFLKWLRQRKGVSLKKVEDDTGISNAYLSQLETGARQKLPGPDRLKALADYYNVSLEQLLEKAGYFGKGDILETKKQEIEKTFQHVINDPDFKYGTRLKGKYNLDAKLFIIEMYQKMVKERLLDSGSGDYVVSKNEIRKIRSFYTRLEFFEWIENNVPVILLFLKNKVLPIYNKMLGKNIATEKTNNNRSHYLDWDYIKHANKDYYSELVPLKDILNEWSAKYNLFDDWIMEAALGTITVWDPKAPSDDKLYWAHTPHIMYAPPFSRKDLRINFHHSGWNPFKLPWEQAKTVIVNDFKQFLEEEYYKESSKLLTNAGIEPPMDKDEMQKQLKWLIDYQVHNKSYTDICNEESDNRLNGEIVDNTTIINGVTSMAELIGLTLRK